MLLALKIAGLLVSSFFGVFALLHDYRNAAGRVTRQGQMAIGGIFLGAVIGSTATVIEELENTRTTDRQFDLLTTQLQNTDDALRRIDRVANRFVISQVSLSIDIESPSLTRRTLEAAATAASIRESDCQLIAEDLGATAAIRFAMPAVVENCQDILAGVLAGSRLPEVRFSIANSWYSDSDAVFNVALSERMPINPHTDLWLYAWKDQGIVQINFDDVPVQFQTESILAIEDFSKKELFARFDDWGFLQQLGDARVRLRWVNMGLQDGRDMPLVLSDPRTDVAGPWWHAEYIFPEASEDVAALVDGRMIAPTDADR
jgi:hypothetical protein